MHGKRPERERSALVAQQLGGRGVEDSRSPADWLVLALVIEQPSHGYEISQRYEHQFASFLPTSVPRVYGALDRLRDAGMIEPIALKSGQPSARRELMRRSYRATRAGVQSYRRWVAERMRDDPQRFELLGRITSTGLFGIEGVLQVVEQYQRECMEELSALPAYSERVERGDASLEELTEALLVDQQRRELRARHDWAMHARRALETHKQRAERARQPAAAKRTGRAGAKS
jgi:DNA-binding PadR family transcriptional regulator